MDERFRPGRRQVMVGLAVVTAVAGLPGLVWAEPTGVGRDDLLVRFTEQGAVGTMVLFDPTRGVTTVIGAERAERRFTPASTFKIANSLIALEVGAVADENEIIPYGGRPQPYPTWEHDMSMREAIGLSAVPIYQELARRVGIERFRDHLVRLDYGNRDPGTVVDRFWLDGPLAISAVEQTRFLARLAKRELPISARAQGIVTDIVRIEARDGRVLHAKTGVCASCRPMVGWWVGWVARGDEITAFALNMDLAGMADAPKRMTIGRAILADLGVH